MKSEISNSRPQPPARQPGPPEAGGSPASAARSTPRLTHAGAESDVPVGADKGFQRHAPTLYVIIASKLLKFAFLASMAIFLYMVSGDDLPADYQRTLRALHLNPEQRFWTDLAVKVGALTEAKMIGATIGVFCYSLFALVEGVGMIFRVGWAGWLTIGESAFFIPIEVLEMIHRFSWTVAAIFALNVFIVWYLYQNRQRLFYDRHQPSASRVPELPD